MVSNAKKDEPVEHSPLLAVLPPSSSSAAASVSPVVVGMANMACVRSVRRQSTSMRWISSTISGLARTSESRVCVVRSWWYIFLIRKGCIQWTAHDTSDSGDSRLSLPELSALRRGALPRDNAEEKWPGGCSERLIDALSSQKKD